MISLTNNRLILNGHRIFTKNELFSYLTKKFKTEKMDEKDMGEILSWYPNLKIAIWHADTFLSKESKTVHDEMIVYLSKFWELKQTWKL